MRKFRVRHIGPTKVMYVLEKETKTKDDALSKAANIRRRGYRARVTYEGGKYLIWQSHFMDWYLRGK